MEITINLSDDEIETFKSYLGLVPCRIEEGHKRQAAFSSVKDKLKFAVLNYEQGLDKDNKYRHTEILLLNAIVSWCQSQEDKNAFISLKDVYKLCIHNYSHSETHKLYYDSFDVKLLPVVYNNIKELGYIKCKMDGMTDGQPNILCRTTEKGKDYFLGLIK